MVKTIKRISGIIILCLLLNACKSKDDSSFLIGKDLVTATTTLVQIDTFTINLSTIRQDSMPTSGYGLLLVGHYDDGHLGKISSNSVFPLGIPSVTDILNTDNYDSVALTLKYSGYFYGDTTLPQTISVHKLIESIKLPDEHYLYNSSKISFDPSFIGSLTKAPTPHNRNNISIKLDDGFGREIFTLLKNKANQVYDNTQFLNYLPGLMLLVDNNKSSSIIGYKAYDSTLMIRLYFHRTDQTVTLEEYDFAMINPNYQYNQIYGDFSGLPISALTDQRKSIPSLACNNESYVQAGTGLMTRIDFPYMGTLLDFARKGKIISAELILKPSLNSTNAYISLPDSLVLYTTDKINRVNGYLTDNSSNMAYAYLYEDDLNNINTEYSIDITTYLFNELNGNFYNIDHGLLVGLRPSLFESTLNRLILSGPGNSASKPQLKIKYIFYD